MDLRTLIRQSRKRLSPLSGLTDRAPELLAGSLFGFSALDIHTRTLQLDAQQQARYENAVERLLGGEPLQYVLGEWAFGPYTFKVDPRALIPREETFALCEWARDTLPFGARVLDAGCGSGCIGLALKGLRADLKVTLGDISPRALQLTEENAARLGFQVEILPLDILKPFDREFDCILSNPPYISAREIALMDESVLRWEPHDALFAEEDGYAFYRALKLRTQESLPKGGWLAVECGCAQAENIRTLWEGILTEITLYRDFSGIPRMVTGRKE